MTINKTQNEKKVVLSLEGRLDTTTAPDLEKEILNLGDVEELSINCAKLDYISSAGLRVFLTAHKTFSKKSGMTVVNVSDAIMDIFEVTGFKEILTIQ